MGIWRTTIQEKVWSKRWLCLLLLFCLFVPLFASTSTKTVKVGLFESIYSYRNDAGKLTGYAYEYQQDIAAYTGWNYEYVSAPWPELMDMLEKGEIDLLSDVSKTPERESTMLFSTEPMGSERYFIYVPEGSSTLSGENLKTLNNKTIGVTQGSLQSKMMETWLEEHNIQATILPVSGDRELADLLEKGKIDAVLGIDAFQSFSNCIPIAGIGFSDIYFAINKNRMDLKVALDSAMNKITSVQPNYNDNLFRKYQVTSQNQYLDAEEKTWLLRHGKIRIGYRDNYLAFCGTNEEGKLVGALKAILEDGSIAFVNANLSFVPVAYPSTGAALEGLKNQEVDCIFPICMGKYDAEMEKLFISSTVIQAGTYAATRPGMVLAGDNIVVAVNKGNPNYTAFLSMNYPNWPTKEYETTEDCFAAIAAGEADCIFLTSYRISNVQDSLKKHNLETFFVDKDMSLSMAVRRNDNVLLSILNKMISLVPESNLISSLSSYSNVGKKISVTDFLMANFTAVAITTGLLFAFFVSLIITVLVALAHKKDAEIELEHRVQEITSLNEKLESDSSNLEKQYSLTEAMSRDVIDAFLVDTKKETSMTFKANGFILPEERRKVRPYKETWDWYINKYVAPEDQEELRRKVQLSNLKKMLQIDTEFVCRYRYDTPSGPKFLQTTFLYLGAPEDGIILFGFRDIDEIVRAEREQTEALREARDMAEARLVEIEDLNAMMKENNDIFANSGYGIWRIGNNPDGSHYMIVNETLAKIFGIEDLEMSPEELYRYYHERLCDDVKEVEEKFYAPMWKGQVMARILKWNHPEKGIIYLSTGGTCYTQINGEDTISGYSADITIQEREVTALNENLEAALKEAKSASNSKTAFLFNMSHDIRTPMNAIMGYSQLIKRDVNNPDKLLHYQEKMEQASEFLLCLINNVLDMARIESGKMEIDNDYTSVEEILNEIYGVFDVAAKEKKLHFHYSTDIKTKHVMTDIVKIKEIYSNLISNAIKYTAPGGTVTLIVKEVPSEKDGYTNIFTTIEDTGIGMSKEYLPHLFEAFTREKNTTLGKVAGTGLGMPIVKSLIELFGGTIEVESELGKGTKFTFLLPQKIAADEYSALDADFNASNDKTELKGKRVLLAEDNALNAEIAITILEDLGLQVDHAADGVICVDKLEKAPAGTYDVILMDIQMPNMDGYKATTVIRKFNDKKKASTPILAMTANAFEEDRKNALEVGMNGHLAKPIQIQRLVEALESVFGINN